MASSLFTTKAIKTTTARTHLKSSRSVLQWNIENVDRILPDEAEVGLVRLNKDSYFKEFEQLKSPVFTTTLGQTEIKKSEQKWFVVLDLVLPGPEENKSSVVVEGNRVIALFLGYSRSTKEPSYVQPVRLFATFSILGKDEKEVIKISYEIPFEKFGDGMGFTNFLPLSELWKNKATYIVENALRIKVDLTAYGSPQVKTMDSGLQECLSFAKNKFIEDMRHLLNSGCDTDLTIHCSGRDFLAHTNILKGRCLVFNRMLEADMTESREKVIKINDVDPIVFEAFLEYIYTGQVELRVEYIDKLLGLVRVADKYGVEELKSICFEYMAENISLENAGEIAVLGLDHNAEKNIRSKIITFCQSNFPSLLKKPNFKACLSENPFAFFHDTTKDDESEVEKKD